MVQRLSVEAPTPDQVANGINVKDLVNANMISFNVPVAFDFPKGGSLYPFYASSRG